MTPVPLARRRRQRDDRSRAPRACMRPLLDAGAAARWRCRSSPRSRSTRGTPDGSARGVRRRVDRALARHDRADPGVAARASFVREELRRARRAPARHDAAAARPRQHRVRRALGGRGDGAARARQGDAHARARRRARRLRRAVGSPVGRLARGRRAVVPAALDALARSLDVAGAGLASPPRRARAEVRDAAPRRVPRRAPPRRTHRRLDSRRGGAWRHPRRAPRATPTSPSSCSIIGCTGTSTCTPSHRRARVGAPTAARPRRACERPAFLARRADEADRSPSGRRGGGVASMIAGAPTARDRGTVRRPSRPLRENVSYRT